MALFRNFRLKRGMSVLRRKVSRMRKVKFRDNIRKAKTMGIVWDAARPDEFVILSRFHQKMAERKQGGTVFYFYQLYGITSAL